MIPEVDLLEELEEELAPNKTFKIDTDELKIKGTIDNIEALKQTIYMILNTERYQYLIYSWNYGIELQDLYGEPDDYVCAELERRITEALIQDERIIGVSDFTFETDKNKIISTFTVNTIYGDIETEKEVEI